MIKISRAYPWSSEPLAIMGLSDLDDFIAAAAHANPHDGRTKQGRAWADGAWAVAKAFTEAVDRADEVEL